MKLWRMKNNDNFAQNVMKQLEDPEMNYLKNKRKEKKKNKLYPGLLQATRQFSFWDPVNEPTNKIDNFEDESIHEKLSWKKNLFADEEDENRDPNYDVSMSSSSENIGKIPFAPFLEEEREGESWGKPKVSYYIDNIIKKPTNLIQKWNRGDIIFKGKYSSGVTPKFERPALKLKSSGNKRKRSDVEDVDLDSNSQERK